MDKLVDGSGNTTVLAKADGSYVLTTGATSITLPPGTYSPMRELKAEVRDGRYYTAVYHPHGITFNVLSPKSVNGFYPFEYDIKYWEPVYVPATSIRILTDMRSWDPRDPTTWGRNEWEYNEIDSKLNWFFKPSTTSTATQSPFTGTANKADVFVLTGTPEFGAETADRITNFNPKEKDKLQIDVSDFGSDAAGTFRVAKNRKALRKALASTTDFIYLKSTGELYYNENGKLPGFGDGGIFAILENKANITTKNVEFL